ncbi:hypothetical protein ACTI_74020 [Actinoplanes sp. OR16]|nr:hypothetical protein ACTI_74020 [Actinoplanes sp. OR16]
MVQLARNLVLLRLTAPRSSALDDPLTLRELSEMTGIPRSTLGNAESGRVLPRVRVVYKFAEQCGVPTVEIAKWIDARNRVAAAARHRRRLQYPSVAEVAERLATPADGSPKGKALAVLSARSVLVADGRLGPALDAVPPALCAGYLAEMDTVAAVECLHAMSTSHAALCLEEMETGAAAALLQCEDPAMAAEHLPLMQAHKARLIMSEVPFSAAAKPLIMMPRHDAEALVSKMPIPWTSALLANAAVPVSLAADLFFTLELGRSLQLIATLPMPRLTGLLAAMDPDPAAGFLGRLDLRQIQAVMAEMAPARAAKIFAHLPEKQAAQILAAASGEGGAALLAETPSNTTAELLAELGRDHRDAILAALPPRERKLVDGHIVPALIGQPSSA